MGVRLSPGALYGAITRLEDRGLIEPLEMSDRRRPYRMTTRGVDALRVATTEMRRIAYEVTARLNATLGAIS